MKIMLDTNVLISVLIFGGRSRETFLKLLDTEHELLVSEYVVNEFADKVCRKWPEKSKQILEAFKMLPLTFCESSEIQQGTLRDKKDIPVLSDALYHNADIILTGDKDFLEADLKKPIVFSLSMIDEWM